MSKTVPFNPNNKKHLAGFVRSIKKLQAIHNVFGKQERILMINSEVYRDIIDFAMQKPWLTK